MTQALERGRIAFFFRPRIEAGDVRSPDDVARLMLVLVADAPRCARLVVVGRKRLPDPSRHERTWAFVAEVADHPDALRGDLEARPYDTRTRGRRVRPDAHLLGEGGYAIARHDAHSHLVYALPPARRPPEAERLFNLRLEAGYIVAVRNPDAPAPPGTGLPRARRPVLPPDLRSRFGDRRWLAVDDPALLNHEGVELVLIGADEHVAADLGMELDASGGHARHRAVAG
jgi:hypothetical protein